MRIGILGDSHGDDVVTARAVALLRDGGARLLIHLGDVGTEAVIETLQPLPARVVFGNCDFDHNRLARSARNAGVTVDHPMGDLMIDGKRIMFTHGDRQALMSQAIEEAADYLLHGHTHVLRDDRFGSTRIINPGALHRAARYTAALLDPADDRLEFVDVPRPHKTDRTK